MGRWTDRLYEMQKQEIVNPKRREYVPIETLSLLEGWQQIEAETWQGVGLLDTMDGLTHIFGKQIIIAAQGRERTRLLQQFPRVLIFTPAEFLYVINEWPKSEMLVYSMHQFGGAIMGNGFGGEQGHKEKIPP